MSSNAFLSSGKPIRPVTAALAAFGLLTVGSGVCYGFDTSKVLLCATIQIEECIDSKGCQTVLPEDVNAPTFFRIDIPRKEIRTQEKGEPTKIMHHTVMGERIILQGVTPESQRPDGGTSWTVSLNQSTARFTIAVTTEQAAIAMFGACTEN